MWGSILIIYTLIRFFILIPADRAETELILSSDEISIEAIVFSIDYFLSLLLNISMLLLAYREIKNLHFSVQLNRQEQVQFLWLKSLLLLTIFMYAILFCISIVSIFDYKAWLLYVQLEAGTISLFCFAIAFFAIRFPVFAVFGDFEVLPVQTQKKYAKSSLKESDSDDLWKKIKEVMETEKAYLNPTFRLNDLAEKTGNSLHHTSQLINQRANMSFSDFVNQYRVKEAQTLLTSPRANEITILAIALEVGFNSKTAFYNAFKKLAGMTPTAFKKSA